MDKEWSRTFGRLKSSHFWRVSITDRFDFFGQTHESQIQVKGRARAPAPHTQENMTQLSLKGKYEYRRRLPHYQKDDRALFVTFCCGCLDPLPDFARDIVLRHCLHDQGTRALIHGVVVMRDRR